jgi:hypothetical protein
MDFSIGGMIDGARGALDGAIDHAAEAAHSVVDTTADAARAVVDTTAGAAQAVAEKTGAALGEAQDAAASAARAAEAHAHDLAASMLESATRAGESAKAGLDSLSDRFRSNMAAIGGAVSERAGELRDAAGAVAGRLSDTVTTGLANAAGEAERLGREIQELPERAAGELREGLRDLGQRAIATGEGALRTVERGVTDLAGRAAGMARDVRDGVAGALDRAEQAGRGLIDEGRKLFDSVSAQLDPLNKVKELKTEGSTFTVGLGAEVDVEATVSAKGELQCTKTKDGYEVKVSGKAGIGVVGQLGFEVGADAEAKAKAEASAGGSVTMKFKTPEEAARAISILERSAVAAGVATNPVVGPLAAQALQPSADDLKFLGDHADSIELKGTAAASVAADLGVGLGEDLQALGLKGEAGVEGNMAVKIQLPHGAEPAKITLTDDIALKAKVSGTAGLKDLGMDGLGLKGEVSGEMKVAVERSYTLPRSIDAKALREKPLETIRGLADRIQATEQDKIKISEKLTGTGGLDFPGLPKEVAPVGNVEGSIQIGAEIGGSPREVGPKIADALRRGDMGALARTLDEHAKLSVDVSTATASGIKLAPSITAFGVGGKVELKYETKQKHELFKQEGRPSEMLERLRQLGQRAHLPDPSLLVAAAQGGR